MNMFAYKILIECCWFLRHCGCNHFIYCLEFTYISSPLWHVLCTFSMIVSSVNFHYTCYTYITKHFDITGSNKTNCHISPICIFNS